MLTDNTILLQFCYSLAMLQVDRFPKLFSIFSIRSKQYEFQELRRFLRHSTEPQRGNPVHM